MTSYKHRIDIKCSSERQDTNRVFDIDIEVSKSNDQNIVKLFIILGRVTPQSSRCSRFNNFSLASEVKLPLRVRNVNG